MVTVTLKKARHIWPEAVPIKIPVELRGRDNIWVMIDKIACVGYRGRPPPERDWPSGPFYGVLL